MRNITLKEMLEAEVADLLSGYRNGGRKYFWKNGDGQYHEIVELDLLRGRFVTDDGDFSEFEWEIKESHIFVDEKELCSFCKSFDFGTASCEVDKWGARLNLAGGCYRFSDETQFNFCPQCGRSREEILKERMKLHEKQ